MIRPAFLLLFMYLLAWAWASRTLEWVLGSWHPWVVGLLTALWFSRAWRYLNRRSPLS